MCLAGRVAFAAGPSEESTTAHSTAVAVIRDVAYGTDPRQRMDIYRPADPSNAPVILMVHGGGWRIGTTSAGRALG